MNFAEGCISEKNFLGVYKQKKKTQHWKLLSSEMEG